MLKPVTGAGQRIGYKGEYFRIAQIAALKALLISKVTLDIAPAVITQRLKNLAAENT